MTSERVEVLMRIVIGIVTGIILELWGYLILALTVINWIATLITGKRLKDISKMCEIWNTQLYTYFRYMTMVSNKRPFPFEPLTKNLSKFEKK